MDVAVSDGLAAVGLAEAADALAGGYSGGMRRRLSVALALAGRPAVVYMDEPSAGLDPASRTLLWQVRQPDAGKECMGKQHVAVQVNARRCDMQRGRQVLAGRLAAVYMDEHSAGWDPASCALFWQAVVLGNCCLRLATRQCHGMTSSAGWALGLAGKSAS